MENNRFNFEKPHISKEKSWFVKTFFTKTVLFVLIGSVLSASYYYFQYWQNYSVVGFTDIVEGVSVGALIGYFMANSPCANNKC